MADIDDATVARVIEVANTKGIKIDADTMRELLTAADVTPVVDAIPVSVGMVAAGRKLWIALAGTPSNALLPQVYRAMEQQRRDEEQQA